MASKSSVRHAASKGYWREADARVVVEALEESGQTLTAFCERHELHPGRLARWRRRLQGKPSRKLRFHPVRLSGASVVPTGLIEVELRGGRRVRVGAGVDVEALCRIVVALEEEPGAC
jgi:transposase